VVTLIARSSFIRSRSRSTPPPRHTRFALAYSFQGRLDEAVDECKEAIAVDRTFGNPYNDIGSYLVKKGKLDEAIE
jgi:Tfp pilus assembly protein PilF